MSKIGFIGLGNMGDPITQRLLAAGHELVVYDVDAGAIARAVGHGAVGADSPAAVADAAETVLTSLPAPQIFEAVACGADGVREGSAVRRLVDLSTIGASATQRVAAALADRSIALVDAPVSGGVGGAAAGTLAVMAAGPSEEVELVRPLLDQLGKVFVVGDRPGMGQVMKVVNNYLSATAIAATAEGLAVAVKEGLDPEIAIEVINAGSGRNTATEVKFPQQVLTGKFAAGFALGGMYKDVRLFTEQAEESGVPIWVGSAVRHLWQYGNTHLGADADMTDLARPIEEWAGVEIRGRGSAAES